ncbi:hypothetical protein AWZ03_014541 [Drosophila navojoa]|uniref:Uncharacterized protein n=1 Tax=Drosophila navojoa TaxID=7232 RepID=A0A484AQR5_DRONA|nr:hypothetical protein AWZ03_014541 [Drosophila navojoa]
MPLQRLLRKGQDASILKCKIGVEKYLTMTTTTTTEDDDDGGDAAWSIAPGQALNCTHAPFRGKLSAME